MSQYLSRFYCGNKEELCNFSEPLEYGKLIDRQYDNLITEVIDQCKGDGKEKGYCCPKTEENMKSIDEHDLEKINKVANGNIFTKDNNGHFYSGQIPVKTDMKNDELESIDLCQCEGPSDLYEECVKKIVKIIESLQNMNIVN